MNLFNIFLIWLSSILSFLDWITSIYPRSFSYNNWHSASADEPNPIFKNLENSTSEFVTQPPAIFGSIDPPALNIWSFNPKSLHIVIPLYNSTDNLMDSFQILISKMNKKHSLIFFI